MPDNLSQLNPSQHAAVEHRGGHLLIVAGPGTGKTHTLTARIARQLQDLSEDKRILAITFTRRAAEEMRLRLQRQIPDVEKKVFIGTFHQFGLSLLKEYGASLGLPADFRVAEENDIMEATKNVWPDKSARDRNLLLEEISRWKGTRFYEDAPAQVRSLTAELRSRGLLDFDDILLETKNLFKKNEDALNRVQAMYQGIFVDEYQDINLLQHTLLKLLIGIKNELTAIGDPNQAIYGFRGADVRFFTTFTEDFPGAMILPLSENYRSAQRIISASSQVALSNDKFSVPALKAKLEKEGRLITHQALTDRAEAEYVVHQIEQLVGGTSMFSQDSRRVGRQEAGSVTFGDIAVLYRLNSQHRVLREAFERSGIPFHISGITSGEGTDTAEDVYLGSGREAEIQAERVSLMTLHSAKGLEFPVVFIVGCEQGLLPLDIVGLATDKEEERRLFYVGMTRAKEKLFLLNAKKRMLYGKTMQNAVSPFLLDIDDELKDVQKRTLKRKPKKDDGQIPLFDF